jgi:carboxylesterase type B
VQSSDCLNLNIYAPLSTAGGPLLPVFLGIHGGAWLGACRGALMRGCRVHLG